MITVLDELPPALLTATPRDLHEVCDELTVIHLDGAQRPPVVVSLMLHGNEPAGLLALQHLFGPLGLDPRALPRALTLLVGNVRAAAQGRRRLDDQPDFNRIWGEPTGRPSWVLTELRRHGARCVIDCHNSSGRNPHFVGVTVLDSATLGLAHAFSRRVVHVTGPSGMLAQATTPLAPSVTVECGWPGDPDGYRVAARLIHTALVADELPSLPEGMPTEVLENLATLRLDDDAALGDGIVPVSGLEALNFQDVQVGTSLCRARPGQARALRAFDDDDNDVSEHFLRYDPQQEGGSIVTSSPCVPVMLTLDERVIRQDCLGYVMKRRRLIFEREGLAAHSSG